MKCAWDYWGTKSKTRCDKSGDMQLASVPGMYLGFELCAEHFKEYLSHFDAPAAEKESKKWKPVENESQLEKS